MSWDSVYRLVFAAISSAGGIGVIIYLVTKNLVSRIADGIADSLQQKKKSEFDTLLAEYKARLDNLGHISKAYFDIETTTYQELCSAFYLMISAVHWLFPTGLDRAPTEGNLREICSERYKRAQETYNDAASVLGSKAPFIDKIMYKQFYDILKLAAGQIHTYSFANPDNMKNYNEQYEKIARKGYEQTDEIDTKWEDLLDKLRDYISSLKSQLNAD